MYLTETSGRTELSRCRIALYLASPARLAFDGYGHVTEKTVGANWTYVTLSLACLLLIVAGFALNGRIQA